MNGIHFLSALALASALADHSIGMDACLGLTACPIATLPQIAREQFLQFGVPLLFYWHQDGNLAKQPRL